MKFNKGNLLVSKQYISNTVPKSVALWLFHVTNGLNITVPESKCKSLKPVIKCVKP